MTSTSSTTGTSGFLNTVSSFGGSSSVVTVDGLSSGIDTTAIVNEMMSIYAQPQQLLSTQLATVQQNINIYGGLSSDFNELQTAADNLSTPSDWQAWQANSSTATVTASAGPGAVGGALSFSVNALASAASLISTGAVTSTNATVASGNILLAQGGTALGFATFADAGQSLTLGQHTVTVTQASTGAAQAGASPLAAATTITAGSNDTISYSLDGAPQSLTIPAGTYSSSQLAAAVTKASGGSLIGSVGNTGNLVLTTTAEGSTHSLALDAGDANATLGLAAGSATTGGDGVVSVDGTRTTLNDIVPGQAEPLADGKGGTITATFSGGLRSGSVTAAEVSTGNGSLAAVASAVNNAGLGFTASAIETAPNSYRLQLLSSTTGSNSTINVDPSTLSGIGGMETLSSGANADITVGQGAGQFDYQSQTNTVTGLMPGVTLTLNSTTPSGNPAMVSLSADGTGMAAQVASLVSLANVIIGDLNSVIGYNSTTGQAGPLLGDSIVTNLYDDVLGAISGSGRAGAVSASGAGITLNNDGTIDFDQAAFTSAYQADPASVSAMFTGGAGTSTNATMTVVDSSDSTAPGTYNVNITRAALQASTTLDNSAAHTFVFSVGTSQVSYASSGTQTPADLAAALNNAFGTNGLGLSATVSNGAVAVTTMGYGSASSFGLGVDGAGVQSFTGTDVAGTIGGLPASGTGQLLIGTSGATEGLIVQLTGTQTGALGSVSYNPGLAASLAEVSNSAIDPLRGSLPQGIAAQTKEVTSLQASIAAWNPILAEQQTLLESQWTAMETAITSLKSTQQQLGLGSSSSSSS